MPTAIIVGLSLVGLYLVVNFFWSRNRVSTNFNLVYVRALRIERNKEIAIAAALRHLKSFLKPFDQLTDLEIGMVAQIFREVDDPKIVLQPVLEHARKTGNLGVLKDAGRLKEWREKLDAQRRGQT